MKAYVIIRQDELFDHVDAVFFNREGALEYLEESRTKAPKFGWKIYEKEVSDAK